MSKPFLLKTKEIRPSLPNFHTYHQPELWELNENEYESNIQRETPGPECGTSCSVIKRILRKRLHSYIQLLKSVYAIVKNYGS